MIRVCIAGALLAFVLGCGPASTPPVKVMVLEQDRSGAYAPKEVELKTVADVVGLHGAAVRLIGGARIVYDEGEVRTFLGRSGGLSQQQVEQGFFDTLVKRKGGPVRASYAEHNRVLWPTDFHSWNMVTAYYNFERASDYFQSSTQVPPEAMRDTALYYLPELEWPGLAPTDNAFYVHPLRRFILVGFDPASQSLPLGMNPGIMAHEYSHQVFNRLVLHGQAFPLPFLGWASEGPIGTSGHRAINLLRSLDEGLADYHAVQASCAAGACNTRFMEPSFPAAMATDRDVARTPPQCLTAELWRALNLARDADFSAGGGLQYRFGSVIASALHKAGEAKGQRQALHRAVLAAYSNASPGKPGFQQLIYVNPATLRPSAEFNLAAVLNALAAHVDDLGLRRELCGQFIDKFSLDADNIQTVLPSCPASAAIFTRECAEIRG